MATSHPGRVLQSKGVFTLDGLQPNSDGLQPGRDGLQPIVALSAHAFLLMTASSIFVW